MIEQLEIMLGQLRRMKPRRFAQQVINFGLIVSSALMIWKSLMIGALHCFCLFLVACSFAICLVAGMRVCAQRSAVCVANFFWPVDVSASLSHAETTKTSANARAHCAQMAMDCARSHFRAFSTTRGVRHAAGQ